MNKPAYTPRAKEYIDSVDGAAHQSAVQIIEKFQAEIEALAEALKDKETKSSEPDVELAMAALISAIYFRDASDFKGALWDALRFLDNDAADLLYESDEEAYKKYVEKEKESK